ncbi:VanW family protein [Kineosporia succinea]|uniref:Vancomycin resistance protein VanW n=1 Tax=Kineosporia succinea TaxID=84632 RepID=A0ABT9P543_9ACTN|nr:VanW family protein [Kineosporia succinea]MDP9827809.1 vancomycin resistance protein VanW [Kineosporia succinea]
MPAVPLPADLPAGTGAPEPTDASVIKTRLPPIRPSERWPWILPLAVTYFRMRRRVKWLVGGATFTRTRSTEPLPVLVKRHRSLLLRQLGDADMWLQRNKVINLRIAAGQLDGVVIAPGETFSFCRLVGRATAKKGYVVGMFLSGGEVRPDIGGGICQAANLLHWMALHSPLTIVERSEHSFDPFPDSGRVIPWGTGTSIFYNYIDLQLRNDTDVPYQLRIRVGETHLEGELRAAVMPAHSYHVEARQERFQQLRGVWWRSNEIWRRVIDRRTGNHVGEELLKKNRARVMYDPTVTYTDRTPGRRL